MDIMKHNTEYKNKLPQLGSFEFQQNQFNDSSIGNGSSPSAGTVVYLYTRKNELRSLTHNLHKN